MLTLIRPFLPYIIVGLLTLFSVGGIYVFVRHQGAQAEREANFKRAIEAYVAEVSKANRVSVALAKKLNLSRLEVRNVNERVDDELSKEPVYYQCVVPASGVQLLNDAIKSTTSN